MNQYLYDNHPKFSNKVIGHEHILENLIASYKANKLHHAYILHGNKGVGKATLAYVFSKIILSHKNFTEPNSFIDNSNSNQNINLIHQNCHPNLLVIEPELDEKNKLYKNTINIEQIRKIKPFLSSSSLTNNTFKIVIIDSIDLLNLNAANSILKILEEPALNRLFLLICHNLNCILPTIKSRTIVKSFSPLNQEQINEIIKLFKISPSDEKYLLSNEIVKVIQNINNASIESYLWLLDNDNFNTYNLFKDIIQNKDVNQINSLAEKIKNFSSYDLQYLLELLIQNNDTYNTYDINSKLNQLKNLLLQDRLFNLDKTAIITSYIIDLIY